MGFLTFGASLIRTLSAVGNLKRRLDDAVHIKNAPNALMALRDEVHDCEELLYGTLKIARNSGHDLTTSKLRNVTNTLEQMKTTVLALESHLQLQLPKASGHSSSIERLAYLRGTPRAETLRNQLSRANLELSRWKSLVNL